jgi:hypothetical protein
MPATISNNAVKKLDSLSPGISSFCFTATGELNEIGKLLAELYLRRREDAGTTDPARIDNAGYQNFESFLYV